MNRGVGVGGGLGGMSGTRGSDCMPEDNREALRCRDVVNDN